MFKNILTIVCILTFLFCSQFLMGCSSDSSLKSNSLSAARIIKEANKRIVFTSGGNIVEGGEITGTLSYYDNSKSIEYLEANSETLANHYNAIKSYYESNASKPLDSLCVLAMLNELNFSLSNKAIDDRCKYAELLAEKYPDELPSDWILKDVYNLIFIPDEYRTDTLVKMSNKEKYESILDFLMSPKGTEESCFEQGS